MRRILFCLILPTKTISPLPAKQIYQSTRRYAITFIGPNIIPTSILPLFILLLSNHQISKQRLQYMLIRTSRIRISHTDRTSRFYSTNTIWDDSVVCEIASADDIPRPGSRNRNTTICKETILIGMCYQF